MATGDTPPAAPPATVKVLKGTVFFANVNNNTAYGSGTITFSSAFATTPVVVVGLTGMNSESSLNNGIFCTCEDISTTSFRIVVCGGGLGSNDLSVSWIAVGT